MRAAVDERAGQHAVGDRRADLRLDVVADDRQLLLEAALPVGPPGDEHRDAVHERAAGLEDLLDVPLGRLFEPTGRYETTTSVFVSLSSLTMSAVEPGAFWMIFDRYLPSPSWVIPRSTLMPVRGTEANFSVLFGFVDLGQVLADLVPVDVDGAENSMSRTW